VSGRLREIVERAWATVDWRARDRDFDDELASHLEAATADYLQRGLTYEEASHRARIDLGSVTLAREQHREARGVTFLDTMWRDCLYAFRSFRRAPLAALTIVATVALGLGLVAVVFTIYNLLLLRPDAVRRPHELFAVTLQRWTGPDTQEDLPLAPADVEAMRAETSVFTEIVAILDTRGPSYLEGRFARQIFVSGNFFQALGVQATLGRALLPPDDERFAARPVIALSHAGWHKLYRGDPAVIGRRVLINAAPYEIVGVMPDGFRGLGITPPDYWAPLAMDAPFDDAPAGRERPHAIEVVGRLSPGLSGDAAAAALSAWASGRAEFKAPRGRPITVRLTPRQGTVPRDGFDLVFAPLFFAFGLILLIGCANVANLLLARGVARQREIGIRLSLGASRPRIIRQLLTESLMLSLAAALCSLLVARLVLDGALYAVISTLPPEIAQFLSIFNLAVPTSDWRVVVFLVAGAIVSTVFFGLAPALQATRVNLVPTMRGEVTSGARPRRARHTLIAVQVGASALLLICAGIFLRGAIAAATRDPGIRTSDTLRVMLGDGPRRDLLLQALTADPLVATIASQQTRGGTISPFGPATPAGPTVLPVQRESVSSDYFAALGIDVVHGRAFEPAERLEAGVMIVSETIARRFWPNGGAVGQLVRLEAPSTSPDARPMASGPFTVVGVVRESAPASGADLDTVRSVYLPAGVDSPNHALVLRVRGNPEQVRQALLERLARVDPAPVMILTYQTMTSLQAYLLQMGFWAAVALGGLALALTVSGVFSVLSYVVEQQAQEIGVRMALGAARRDVVELILLQSVRPVGLGLAAGTGLAAAVAIVLMTTPIASEISGDIDVLDPVAYLVSLVVIVTSCALAVSVPALRAARIDPIATLKKA
jgi:predicted permease